MITKGDRSIQKYIGLKKPEADYVLRIHQKYGIDQTRILRILIRKGIFVTESQEEDWSTNPLPWS